MIAGHFGQFGGGTTHLEIPYSTWHLRLCPADLQRILRTQRSSS